MTVRQDIVAKLRSGELNGNSNLRQVKGIGPYLGRRLVTAFQLAQGTLGQLWANTQNLSTDQVIKKMERALQNKRGNQCVSKRTRRSRSLTYHNQDINQFGWEAMVTLLDHARNNGGTRYGTILKRQPRRGSGSKTCGCRLRCDGPCVRIGNGDCVPRRGNGFMGVSPHPNQVVRATTNLQRSRIRNSARTRMTNALRADPDSMIDWNAGNRRSIRYVRQNDRMVRSPSAKVRLPIV